MKIPFHAFNMLLICQLNSIHLIFLVFHINNVATSVVLGIFCCLFVCLGVFCDFFGFLWFFVGGGFLLLLVLVFGFWIFLLII